MREDLSEDELASIGLKLGARRKLMRARQRLMEEADKAAALFGGGAEVAAVSAPSVCRRSQFASRACFFFGVVAASDSFPSVRAGTFK